jgi:DNA repair protein RadD
MYAAKAIDVEGMKVVAGEWSEKEIEERGLDIIGDIVAEWHEQDEAAFRRSGKDRRLLSDRRPRRRTLPAVPRRWLQLPANQLQGRWRPASPRLDRRIPQSRFAIHGLVSCEVFTKGFDVPDVMCGISARPYRKSLSSHIQQMGRVMRASPGKAFGSGSTTPATRSASWATRRRYSRLAAANSTTAKREAKARKEPTAQERESIRCSCGYVMQVYETKCPGCGKERKRMSMVETFPGQMHELELGKRANREMSWERSRFSWPACAPTRNSAAISPDGVRTNTTRSSAYGRMIRA